MVLKIERLQPEGMNVRMSDGKPSYSHVVTVSGSGKIVYTAGQLARDIDGNCVCKGDMRAQMEQTFQNLDRGGFEWNDAGREKKYRPGVVNRQNCQQERKRGSHHHRLCSPAADHRRDDERDRDPADVPVRRCAPRVNVVPAYGLSTTETVSGIQ